MLSHGQVLVGSHGNRWRVSKKLGEGRCCEVYQAEIIGENVQGAVRVCKPGYDVSKKELYILQDVRQQRGMCTNLVSVIDQFTSKGKNLVVQELLDLDLFNIQQMAGGQGMSLYLVQTLLKDLARSLVDLHSCGYVHADIKPSNLMWSQQDGCLKLIDFGLSFHVNQKVMGQVQSRSYRAPEVSLNDPKLSTNKNAAGSARNTGGQDTQDRVEKCKTTGTDKDSYCHRKINKDKQSSCSQKGEKTVSNGQIGQVKGRKVRPCMLTPAIDLWSVGCLIYWMYTGQKMSTLKPGGMTICSNCKVVDSADNCEHSVLMETTLTQTSQDKPAGWSQMVELICSLIHCRPGKRLTASQVMEHDFIQLHIEPEYVDLLVLPVRVVRLLNVIQDEDLEGDTAEFDDLVADIRAECEKYGALEACHVPKEGQGRGKAYMKYERAADAVEAFEKLNGREFDGRTVLTTYFSSKCLDTEDLF